MLVVLFSNVLLFDIQSIDVRRTSNYCKN